jgi:hypothetical protein
MFDRLPFTVLRAAAGFEAIQPWAQRRRALDEVEIRRRSWPSPNLKGIYDGRAQARTMRMSSLWIR